MVLRLNDENESRTQTSFSCECSDRFRLNPVLLQHSAQLSDPSKMWTGWDGKRFDSPSVVRSREASSLTDGPLIDLHCLFLLKAAWPNVTCPFIIHTTPYKQTNIGSIHQVFVCVSTFQSLLESYCSDNWWVTVSIHKKRLYLRCCQISASCIEMTVTKTWQSHKNCVVHNWSRSPDLNTS